MGKYGCCDEGCGNESANENVVFFWKSMYLATGNGGVGNSDALNLTAQSKDSGEGGHHHCPGEQVRRL